MTIFNKKFSDFNGTTLPVGGSTASKLEFTGSISTATNINACTTAANCKLQFDRAYTPLLMGTTPSNVYAGQDIQFNMLLKDVLTNLPAGEMPVKSIALGDTLVDYGDTLTEKTPKPSGWSNSHFWTKVSPSHEKNLNLNPKVRFTPGYAVNTEKAKTCNFANTDCWEVRVHPRIDSISSSEGYNSGGQEITLTGQSLNGTTTLPPLGGEGSCVEGQGNCLACTGDCDNDSDCSGSLLCWERSSNSPDVPGCQPATHATRDYCFDPDLTPTDISVLVDEVPCKVSRAQSNSEKIVCTTGKKTSVSIHGNQPGSQGIMNTQLKKIDKSAVTMANIVSESKVVEQSITVALTAQAGVSVTNPRSGEIGSFTYKCGTEQEYSWDLLTYPAADGCDTISKCVLKIETGCTAAILYRDKCQSERDKQTFKSSSVSNVDSSGDPLPDGTVKSWDLVAGNFCQIVVSTVTTAPTYSTTQKFASSFELLQNTDKLFGSWFQGYFVAPATGKYRFWISGSDKVELYMNSSPYASSPNALLTLIDNGEDGCTDADNARCAACTGDCDSDSQCAIGLKCFIRNGIIAPPGCKSGGTADRDFCYDPLITTHVDLTTPSLIIASNSATGWREYEKDLAVSRKSAWIDLVQGKNYYTEAKHTVPTVSDLSAASGEHMTVSVEIQADDVASNHPNQMKAEQLFEIKNIDEPEQWSVSITSSDSLKYKINILNAFGASPVNWQSEEITTNASAAQFKTAIQAYYSVAPLSSDITVVRQAFNANDTIETNSANVTRYVYTVSLLKRINGVSSSQHSIAKVDTAAQIQITTPEAGGQLSGQPLGGKFKIQCTDPTTKVAQSTADIDWNASVAVIQEAITYGIPFLADKIQVKEGQLFTYKENGRQFYVHFVGLNQDPGQCTVASGTTTPLTGMVAFNKQMRSQGKSFCTATKPCFTCWADCDEDADCAGTLKCKQRSGQAAIPGCTAVGGSDVSDYDYCYDPNYPSTVTMSSTTVRPFGGSLFFEPVPLEFLRANDKVPQVTVSVAGIQALCPSFNCGYKYVQSIASITLQVLSGLNVQIQGEHLPLTNRSIYLHGVLCNLTTTNSGAPSFTSTQLEIFCALASMPAGGNWDVKMVEPKGVVAVTTTTKITIPITVTSVSPNTNLNPLGGDTLTISGTNFDPSNNLVNTVRFDDQTHCVVQTVTSTRITCITGPIVKNSTAELAKNKIVQVRVNGILNADTTVTCKAFVDGTESVSPTSASPFLYTDLTILMKSGFSGTLVKENTQVDLLGKDKDGKATVNSMLVSRVIPTPLDNYGWGGCTAAKPCKLSCQGDCDTDNDCVAPLTCLDRTEDTPAVVLGCTGTALTRADYCYNPAYDGRKRIMVKFPGAYSGDYKFKVSTTTEGIIQSSDLSLKAVAEITNYSPRAGSSMGGTLLTITGRHFSTNILDNPVTIGTSNVPCTVESATETQIMCRIPATTAPTVDDKDLIKVQIGSETAQCNKQAPALFDAGISGCTVDSPCPLCKGDCDSSLECEAGLICKIRTALEPVSGCTGTGVDNYDYCYDPNPTCAFTWETPPIDIVSKTVLYDSVSKSWKLTLTTTASHKFKSRDTTSNVVLTLDGNPQVPESIVGTTAVFRITNMLSQSTSAVTLKTLDGYTTAKSITTIGTVSITPKFTEISTTTASTKGSTVTVTAPGLGVNTTGVQLGFQLSALLSSGATPVCSSVSIYEYGKFSCVLTLIEIPLGTKMQLMIGSTLIDCESDATSCSLTMSTTQDPYVNTITKVADILINTMQVKGTNWPSDTDYQIFIQLKDSIAMGTSSFAAGVWTSNFDFEAAYFLVKSNAYCSGVVVDLGNSANVADCSAKVYALAEGSTQYFRYGKGSAAQKCEAITCTVLPLAECALSTTNQDYHSINFKHRGTCITSYTADVNYDFYQTRTNYGIPVVAASTTPVIYWTHRTSTWTGITASNVSGFSLVNALTGRESTYQYKLAANYEKSFAGGTTFAITNGPGITTSMRNSSSQLTLCGVPATFVRSGSTFQEAKFTVPAMATSQSNTLYEINKSKVLSRTWTGTASATELAKLSDGNLANSVIDNSSTCYLQTDFKAQHVGVLDEVSIYINGLYTAADTAKIANKLRLDGSDDLSNWVKIYDFGNDLHNGWNTYKPNPKPTYKHFRFSGIAQGACRLAEIRLKGVEQSNLADVDTLECIPQLTVDGQTEAGVTNKLAYKTTKTALVTGISPRYGSVSGDTQVTITGTNFKASGNLPKFDGIACVVTTESTTQIVCKTGPRPTTPGVALSPPSFTMLDSVNGFTVVKDFKFEYVSLYSESQTWAKFQPVDGESITIPVGHTLLVDVAKTALLNTVIVEGKLMFIPDANASHQRSFDAKNILVRGGGAIEVGTATSPYTSKLTITMHGTKHDPQLPIFGAKGLGVQKGTLDMHGVSRTNFAYIQGSFNAGATQITLAQSVDWKVGEYIVVASSDLEGRHAEKRMISAVNGLNVVTLSTPLTHKHYSIDVNGVTMNCEVILLTRNIVFRGDTTTSASNLFGAHVMINSQGDEASIARIQNVEFTDVGQANNQGRFPIHFRNTGLVYESFLKGNSIHQTYNRGVNIDGAHNLKVENNVVYDTMGHSILIESASETNNEILNNVVVQTKKSFNLLNSDQYPASFYITHPTNTFERNHAAGSDKYGIWYDLKTHSRGYLFSKDICPNQSQLSSFQQNYAHSNGMHGFRLHYHNPRQYGCTTFNSMTNPNMLASYKTLSSYMNKSNGAIAGTVGEVVFDSFNVADNLVAGVEFEECLESTTDKIKGGVFVGKSDANTETEFTTASPRGIITPRTDYFKINGAQFYAINFNQAAALGSCSQCFNEATTDSGGRTVTVNGLSFNNVNYRINYQAPYRAIYYDEDGSLTGNVKGWATPYWKHNEWPECVKDDKQITSADRGPTATAQSGLKCTSAVQVRSISFNGYTPSTFLNQGMNIAQWSDSIKGGIMDVATWAQVKTNFSDVPFRSNPSNGWTMPFVTGKNYRIWWGDGIDFTQMTVEVNKQWATIGDNGNAIRFTHPYTEARAGGFPIKTYSLDGSNEATATGNLSGSSGTWETGYKAQDIPNKTIDFAVNGSSVTKQKMIIQGYKCTDNVCTDPTKTGPIEGTERLWSNPASWPTNRVPRCGEEVEVQMPWNMVYDMAVDPCIYKSIVINGRLTLKRAFTGSAQNINLKAKHIFVAKELCIGYNCSTNGAARVPSTDTYQITLYGEQSADSIVYNKVIEAGNKALSSVGKVYMYGTAPSHSQVRLKLPAQKGQDYIIVDTGLDWKAGQKVYIAPTGHTYTDSDYAEILSYQSSTGRLTLTAPLNFYHYGTASSTSGNYQYGTPLDLRAEVIMLSRNVRIVGDSSAKVATAILKQTDKKCNIPGTTFDFYGQTVEDCAYQCKAITGCENFNFDAANNMCQWSLETSNASTGCLNAAADKFTGTLGWNHYQVGEIDNPNKDWGCQFVASDTYESDGTHRQTDISLDNIELENCSQRGTQKAALRFKGALTKTQNVTGVVVHGGQGWGMSVTSSAKLTLQSSYIIGFKNIGLNVHSTVDLTVTSLYTADIRPADPNLIEKQACVAICSYFETDSNCKNIVFTDSHAVGCVFAGFVSPGHTCGSSASQTNFKRNIARSIEGSGARIYPNPADVAQKTCYEASHFSAAWCTQNGLVTNDLSKKFILNTTQFVDNILGVSLQVGDGAGVSEVEVKSTHIWGEDTAMQSTSCTDRIGFMFNSGLMDSKPLHPLSASQLPIYKVKSDAAWSSTNTYGITFHAFLKETLQCGNGKKQHAIGSNPTASDQIHIQKFHGSVFENVALEALAYIAKSPESQATQSQCGDFACTGPENVVARFTGTTFTGSTQNQYSQGSTFQVVGNYATKAHTNCSLQSSWNAYLCTNPKISQVIIQSLDDDALTRSVQPVYLIEASSLTSNKVNAFMDHGWETKYTTQNRLSRFVAQIEVDKDYTIQYTSTPPKKQRIEIQAGGTGTGSIFTIKYAVAGAYQVYVKLPGASTYTLKAENAFQDNLGKPAKLTKATGCGENRFVGLDNQLEIYATIGCSIEVRPVDSLLVNVRMDTTIAAFYADGGVTKFATRVAAALNIDISRVKIITVYAGSVNVNHIVTADPTAANVQSNIAALETTITQKIRNGNYLVGGPTILNAHLGATQVAQSYGYGLEIIPSAAVIQQGVYVDLSSQGGSNTESWSVSEFFASATMALVPTALLLWRQPEVFRMLKDLVHPPNKADSSKKDAEYNPVFEDSFNTTMEDPEDEKDVEPSRDYLDVFA